MISLMRVDDRLLHGQVAFLWTKTLTIQTIIIANDRVAHDEFLKLTFSMSKPMGVDLQILDVAQAAELVKKEELNSKHVLVVVESLRDAKAIIEASTTIKALNLGQIRERENSKRYSQSVTLTEEDVEIIKGLLAKNIEVYIRTTPDDKKNLVDKLL